MKFANSVEIEEAAMKGRRKNGFVGSSMAACVIAALLIGGSGSAQDREISSSGPSSASSDSGGQSHVPGQSGVGQASLF